MIIKNITKYENYNVSYWCNVIAHKSLKNMSLWDPNHVKFIKSLLKEYNINDEESMIMTYSETLDHLDLSGDYLYSDWENILNHHIEINSNESWLNKYIDDRNISSYNHDNIDDEMDDLQLSTHNLSDIIPWNSLDPVQQHFLRKANHSLLENFISSLTKHQRKFLDWIIFCHLYGRFCENGHSPIDLLHDKHDYYLKLKNYEWSNINELPALKSSEKHNDMLQFVTAFHGRQDNEPQDEWQYIPTIYQIKNNINTISNILKGNKLLKIMTIGIGMSYAHIPKKIHQWLDCQLSISLYNAVKIESTQFVRFQPSEGDEKVPHHKCLNELLS